MKQGQAEYWWEKRWVAALAVILSAVPLLWPDIPPTVDLPGHMGRYEVQLRIAESPTLQQFYHFDWSLIGNLGLDLLIIPLSAIFGLELATKLIVIAIPMMTAGGFLWVAREVHGRIPPTAYFALPFAYNFPFHFGFVNFALSMGLAFIAFAFWLRLARLGRTGLRAWLFVPISLIVWVTHTFGWGTLGVMAFSAELVRQFDLKRPFFTCCFRACLHSLALAPPVLLMVLWRSGGHVTGETADWFNWDRKLDWLIMVLRDRWEMFDLISLGIIGLVLLCGLLFFRKLQYSRNLAASAIFLGLVFLLLPRIVFGSAYADMRLVPYMIAVAVIAIRFRGATDPRWARVIAVLAIAFFTVRTAGTTVSMWLYDKDYDRQLAALDHVPRDARLITFIGRTCYDPWKMSRVEHLSGIAIVRRHAFSNDQWSMAGAQLLTVRHPQGRGYNHDPSQMVTDRKCRGEFWRPVDKALANFPRQGYDYVWLIHPPAFDPALTRGLQPLWRDGGSILYRVADRTPPLAPAKGAP